MFENGAVDELGEFKSGVVRGTDDAVKVSLDHSREKMALVLALWED